MITKEAVEKWNITERRKKENKLKYNDVLDKAHINSDYTAFVKMISE